VETFADPKREVSWLPSQCGRSDVSRESGHAWPTSAVRLRAQPGAGCPVSPQPVLRAGRLISWQIVSAVAAGRLDGSLDPARPASRNGCPTRGHIPAAHCESRVLRSRVVDVRLELQSLTPTKEALGRRPPDGPCGGTGYSDVSRESDGGQNPPADGRRVGRGRTVSPRLALTRGIRVVVHGLRDGCPAETIRIHVKHSNRPAEWNRGHEPHRSPNPLECRRTRSSGCDE
jgi:hypothetical protein